MVRSRVQIVALAVAAALLPVAAAAQQPAPVTAISKADIAAVLQHKGAEGAGVDRQMKVVDLGKYNMAVGVLRRGPTKPGAPVGAITHSQVTEVFYVVSGGATLVTGGEVIKPVPFPADIEIVKIAVGPSTNGTFKAGDRLAIAPGDIVIVPAGVPHGFDDIKDELTYLSFRPDPDHVLPAGYVHPALRK
jgi:mannose-6-phosphate isomerase-like protein (cupin superfamily)